MITNDFYKYDGLWWQSNGHDDQHFIGNIYGPFCLDCYAEISLPGEARRSYFNDFDPQWVGEATCSGCGKKYVFKTSPAILQEKVAQILRSNFRATLNKIALDEPVSQIKVKDEDDKYFLAAKIGQKDGKKVGVVYFGEKKINQEKTDYSQIFIDLEDEQVRFDKSNKHPRDIVAKFSVEFPNTISTIKVKG